MNNNKLIAEIDGQRKEFDICFTFVCKQLNKGYVAYTDHSLDDQGREKLHVSVYDPNVGFDELGEVTTQEEKDLINSMIEKLKNMS